MVESIDPTHAARHFLYGCEQAGLSRLIVSPGSRSAPLAVAAASSESLSISVHLDERSAAFAALGEAKASGRPVGLICTSGTAGANYLPAIAEASQSLVPLLVVTADRPPEHVGWGVGQAFDQLRLYGSHVRADVLMPVGGDGGLDHAQRAGWRSTHTAITELGPVHVNWPFRLPLEPPSIPGERPRRLHLEGTRISEPSDATVATLTALVSNSVSGVIVAGPGAVRPGPDEAPIREAIWEFSRAHSMPILADVLSGLRNSPPDVPVVEAADLVVASNAAPRCDLILRIGDTPTAKSVRLWWEDQTEAAHLLFDPQGRWQDPSHIVTHVFNDAPHDLLAAVRAAGQGHDRSAESWLAHGREARDASNRVLDGSADISEAHIARVIGQWMSERTVLVASSSMPVRDADTFLVTSSPCDVFSNRGINGIDGVVSTAIGISRGRPKNEVAVLIGDIALLHDIGGLLDAARQDVDLVVVVANNDGGGIFSFLPIRTAIDDATYDQLFHTPHGTTFDFLAGQQRIDHMLAATTEELIDGLETARGRAGVHIIEVPVDTAHNVAVHRDVTSAVNRALE